MCLHSYEYFHSKIATQSCLNRADRLVHGDTIHDALQVVGQYLKTHFGAYPSERPGQKVCGTHPLLERTEYMLNGTSADGHCIRLPVEPALHGFQNMFVLPSSDSAIVAGRTSLLEMATRAGTGPVHPQTHVMLNRRESMNCALACGASILIVPCNVDEVALGKENGCRNGCFRAESEPRPKR